MHRRNRRRPGRRGHRLRPDFNPVSFDRKGYDHFAAIFSRATFRLPARPPGAFLRARLRQLAGLRGRRAPSAPCSPGSALRCSAPISPNCRCSACFVAAYLAGIWFIDVTGKALGDPDHGSIVWDEIVPFWLVLLMTPDTFLWQLAAFVLFRYFDITAAAGPLLRRARQERLRRDGRRPGGGWLHFACAGLAEGGFRLTPPCRRHKMGSPTAWSFIMSHKHAHLMRSIFQDPPSANIHWREIESCSTTSAPTSSLAWRPLQDHAEQVRGLPAPSAQQQHLQQDRHQGDSRRAGPRRVTVSAYEAGQL